MFVLHFGIEEFDFVFPDLFFQPTLTLGLVSAVLATAVLVDLFSAKVSRRTECCVMLARGSQGIMFSLLVFLEFW